LVVPILVSSFLVLGLLGELIRKYVGTIVLSTSIINLFDLLELKVEYDYFREFLLSGVN
jgi:hypothetical protein